MNTLDKLFFSTQPTARLIRHVSAALFLILAFSWIAYTRDTYQNDVSGIILLVTINAFFFFSYAYLTTYIIVPAFLLKKRFLLFFLTFLISGFLLTMLKYYFSDYLFFNAVGNTNAEATTALNLKYLLVNTKDMTFVVAIFMITKYAKDNHHKKRRLHELNDEQANFEIRLLKNQMDPHIIFNNLNNLYSLALQNSNRLSENVARLRSILEYYFTRGKSSRVNVVEELQIIDDYIGLEKLRYADRLQVNYSEKGVFEGLQVAPFLLFSIVENCFQHGCSDDSGRMWIKIHIQSSGHEIKMHASNSKPGNIMTGPSLEKNKPGSIAGLLSVYYPGKHSLKIDDRESGYYLDLKLKL